MRNYTFDKSCIVVNLRGKGYDLTLQYNNRSLSLIFCG